MTSPNVGVIEPSAGGAVRPTAAPALSVVYGPANGNTLWSGFGGRCQTDNSGDPVIRFDAAAQRWVVSQFAINSTSPDFECVAVSQTDDATGAYNRYAFSFTNFPDYPKMGVWPDAYYMSMNVFNSSGTAFLGPQPFAFNRAAMLAGNSATFITPGITGGSGEETYLPADLDGNTLPPSGAPFILSGASLREIDSVMRFDGVRRTA